jgi:hypothetical protein
MPLRAPGGDLTALRHLPALDLLGPLTIAFRSGWEGVIGFLLLPYTTLFYALVYAPGKGVDSFGWFIVALGVVLDLSSHLFGSRERRRRTRRATTT